jgi:hypothetical protein
VLCGLAALPLALPVALPGPAGGPAAAALVAAARTAGRQQALLDNALALEARLEHTPVALFRIDGGDGEGQAAPLNANARKLVAPGRASDPADLYRQLAAQPGERRTTR